MRAVLLLHGFLTNYKDFGRLTGTLRKKYDHVIEFVFPGHLEIGATEPYYKDFTCEKTFELIDSTVEKLLYEYDDLDVVGFSMGGAVGTYIASKYPIRKLVLLSPANKFFNLSLPLNRLSFFIRAVLERTKKITNEDVKKIDKEMESVRIDDVRSVEMAFKELLPNYSIHTVTTFVRIINKCNKSLTQIDCPTLIIWGELDQLVPKKSIEDIQKICINEDVKLIVYDDISHLMFRSCNANKIEKDVVKFLSIM